MINERLFLIQSMAFNINVTSSSDIDDVLTLTVSDLLLMPQLKELRAIFNTNLFTIIFSGVTP